MAHGWALRASLVMPSTRRRRAIAVAVAAAAVVSFGGGTAFADEPGGQGGVTAPPAAGPGQGGVTPTPEPAPAPPAETAPPVDSGPGSIPDPVWYPSAPPVVQGWDEPGPTYPQAYSPVPQGPVHLPKPTKPVTPVLPRPGYVMIGNQSGPQPDWLSDPDTRSINRWNAKFQADIATALISVGVPEDEATRQAAAMMVGIVAGSVTGFMLTGPVAAVVFAATGALIGLGIATAVAPMTPPPFTPFAPLIGAGAGGAAGAAGGLLLVGGAGAIAGGVVGGLLGWLFGAGDPGASADAPPAPGTPESELSHPEPPNPDANQYELDAEGLPGNGSVSYVVNAAGDVSGSVDVGPMSVPLEWSAAQADAPYEAAGFFAQTARDTVTEAVVQVSSQIEQAIPGVRVEFPQFAPADK